MFLSILENAFKSSIGQSVGMVHAANGVFGQNYQNLELVEENIRKKREKVL